MTQHNRSIFQRAVTLIVLLLMVLSSARAVSAQSPAPPVHPVNIYLFWGDGCPVCAKAKPYLESLQAKFLGVTLKTYEVWYDENNQKLFLEFGKKFGFEPSVVPTFFIGSYYVEGYAERLNPEIEGKIQECLLNGCPDAGEGILSPIPTPTVSATEPLSKAPVSSPTSTNLTASNQLEVPLLGVVDLGTQSATLSTVLIALVDGFNPCSLWVLSILLALTLHTGSRKKVIVIGLVFLTVTALIYALIIAGLFSVLKITSFLGWIQGAVALVALFFGLVNIKDYFWYKEGISFTIADDEKPGLFKRIRKVMDASQSLWGLIGATIVLAAGVSMIEFSCTAGFPVLWTNLLTSQNVEITTFILLLLLYMLIYQLDELVIFFSAVVTLKANRVEEKHGRLLKLIGGMLMLTLAGVMLVNPELMNSLIYSLVIFGIALMAACIIILVHRWLLPKIGIHIGNEEFKSPLTKKSLE